MTVPMMVLALGSLVLGAVLYPTGIITDWLEPVFGHAEHGEPLIPLLGIQILVFVLMLAGVGLAWMQYGPRADVPQTAPEAGLLTTAARRDLFQDDVNDALVTGPTMALVDTMVDGDKTLVEGAVTGGTTSTLTGVSGLLRRAQNGFVRSYALTMLLGVVAILGAVWVM